MVENMNTNILAVDIKHCSTYDFLQNGETTEQLLQRANDSKEKDIASWIRNVKNYPDVEDFRNYLKSAQEKEYRVMTWEEFEQFQKRFLLDGKLTEITAEVFDDMLNVLPPLYWMEHDGVEMFCMSEMYTGTYTNQYAHDKRTDKYYTKMVDSADKNTWICELLKEVA